METLRSNTIAHPPLWTRMNVLWLMRVLISCLLFAPSALLGTDSATRSADPKTVNTHFALVVHDGRLSLVARQASLQAIIDEIGRRMNVEVDSDFRPGRRSLSHSSSCL